MKLLNFNINGELKLGVKTELGILDIERVGLEFNEDVPRSMEDLKKVEIYQLLENWLIVQKTI